MSFTVADLSVKNFLSCSVDVKKRRLGTKNRAVLTWRTNTSQGKYVSVLPAECALCLVIQR